MHTSINELLQYFSFAVLIVLLIRQGFKWILRIPIAVEMDLFFATVNSLLIVLPKSLYLTFMEFSFLEPVSDGLGWILYSIFITFIIWSILFTVIKSERPSPSNEASSV